jgi:hypothetical protein
MARKIPNRLKISSTLGFELTGYIGIKSSNTFKRIDSSQIEVLNSNNGWVITIKDSLPQEFVISINVTKQDNFVSFIMAPFNKTTLNLDDIFITLLIRDYRTSSFYTVYHGNIKSFKTRDVELPSQVTLGLDEFAASIASSVRDAQKSISEALGDNSFGLEIGDLEIKTPYVTQVGNNKKLIMKMPQPSEKSASGDQVFSKINFKKVIKLS